MKAKIRKKTDFLLNLCYFCIYYRQIDKKDV